MAYTGGTLSLLNRNIEGSLREWLYITADSLTTVLGASYFSDATNRGMQKGDVVWVVNQTTPYASICQVSSVAAGSLAAPGAATVITADISAVTDSSGGTANAATGIIAAACKQQLVIPIGLYTGIVNTNVYRVNVPFAFTLLSAGVRPSVAVTTGAKAATLTATVGAQAALTGGVIAMTSVNQTPVGLRTAASAISGATATGTAGMAVEFTASSVTAFLEGAGSIEAEVSNNDLANAIATLAKFG